MEHFDLKHIPPPIYEQLVSFMGEEEANGFIVKHDYHIFVIIYKIRYLEVLAFIRKKPILHSVIVGLVLIAIIVLLFRDFIFF